MTDEEKQAAYVQYLLERKEQLEALIERSERQLRDIIFKLGVEASHADSE